ncbi:helix-turn-helix domain-containing protein [Flavobacterium hercynium]|uniref:Transcriptional regulator n=1 Tax=Flavobacterium hercynium TaxID=387094 RepID=A0A226HJ51_9FLAO|nr:helix-turn-helix transcriptional regulator [Flavobacterium hercynium]OXA94359.1 transcriptional regulator [Flavobacterium hercynium]SMP29152.1 DNA-binding transcriptional regulator, XRE-family HTH domain [Flavobacterium hercynium]
MNTPTKQNHIGRKISRIRELKDMKQEALAIAMGTNQQTVSMLENSEEIDDEKLIEVAKALGVSVEAIKNFSDEGIINYFNTFNDNYGNIGNYHCSFNPLDKVVELYERMVLIEKERADYWEKLSKEK